MKYIFPLLCVLLVVVPRVAVNQAAPVPTYGFEVSVPGSLSGDRAAAQALAGLCDGLADVIEADGLRAEPRLTYCISILDIRQGALDVMLSGKRIGDTHPAFGPAVAAVFATQFSDGSLPLNLERRALAVSYFRGLASVCGSVQ